jgi:putative transposase
MSCARQLSFLPPTESRHGGDVRPHKRKTLRPIDTKKPMHLTLRSTRARGQWSMLAHGNRGRVYVLMTEIAERYGVKVYRFENVGNHLHLLISVQSRRQFQTFLRVLAGQIVFLITGAKKGNAVGKFWDKLAFSRIVNWGRDFTNVSHYFFKNAWESFGFSHELLDSAFPPKKTKKRLEP